MIDGVFRLSCPVYMKIGSWPHNFDFVVMLGMLSSKFVQQCSDTTNITASGKHYRVKRNLALLATMRIVPSTRSLGLGP